jgi:glycosyltransferase involved in cell wall biosynthesis
MKKVLVVATTPLGYDGISKVIKQICIYSDFKRIHIDLVLGEGATQSYINEIKEIIPKIHIYYLPSRKRNLINYFRDLVKTAYKEKYDIIHVHGNSATMFFDIFAGWIAHIPNRIAHSHNSNTKHLLIHILLKPFLNLLVNNPVACSYVAGKWVFYKKFSILKNSIELNQYKFNENSRKRLRSQFGLENSFVIGHIGRFNYQKNHIFLVKIFEEVLKRNQKAKLLLVGEGELLEDIKHECEKMNIISSIVFAGNTDNIPDFLCAMDCFVFPSLFEGLGIVAIEAQAAGLKTLCSDNIPKEVQITKLLEYMSLSNSSLKWAEKILSYDNRYERKDLYEEIKRAGYDAMDLATQVEELYLEFKEKTTVYSVQ